MALSNYRDNTIVINGQPMTIGGFARPSEGQAVFEELKNEHDVGAVVSLSGNYSKAFSGAGLDSRFYTHGSHVEVYDWYDTPLELTEPIPPSVYDAVYESVVEAQKSGQKIAIHCGAGDGRTGTALTSLKLRELLEEQYKTNPDNFTAPQDTSETIHVHFGAKNTGEACDVEVTPLVYQAINAIRQNDNPGHHSVESPNDVRTLLEYEKHLRVQLQLANVSKQTAIRPFSTTPTGQQEPFAAQKAPEPEQFSVQNMLREGEIQFLNIAMESIEENFITKKSKFKFKFLGSSSREKYQETYESMKDSVDRLIELNDELQSGTKREPAEVVQELESYHRNILQGIADLHQKTDSSSKKEALLQNMTKLVESSSYPISQVKRQIASQQLQQIKARVKGMDGFDKSSFKELEQNLPVTLQETRLSEAQFESMKEMYSEVGGALKIRDGSDAATFLSTAPIAIDMASENVSKLASATGMDAKKAEGFQLGTNMITQNFGRLAEKIVSGHKKARDIVLQKLPQHLSQIRAQNLDVEIAGIQQEINAYLQYEQQLQQAATPSEPDPMLDQPHLETDEINVALIQELAQPLQTEKTQQAEPSSIPSPASNENISNPAAKLKQKLKQYYSHGANSQKSRFHAIKVDGHSFADIKDEFKELRGDNLKKQILDDVKEKLEDINDPSKLEEFVSRFKDTSEYKVLKTGQGLTTKAFNLKTSSVKALESMVEEKKEQLNGKSHKLG